MNAIQVGGLLTALGGITMMIAMVAPMSSKPPIIGISMCFFVASIIVRVVSKRKATDASAPDALNPPGQPTSNASVAESNPASDNKSPAMTESVPTVTEVTAGTKPTEDHTTGAGDDRNEESKSTDLEATTPLAAEEAFEAPPQKSARPLKLVECPSCRVRVCPKSDGRCPSCQERITSS